MAESTNATKPTKTTKSAAARAKAARLRRAARERSRNHASGFVEFIREQGVIGLAIGLVLGIQVKAVVDQLVASFVNPILGLVMPGKGGLEAKTFSLTIGSKTADFGYGAFVSVLISFLVVAAVIYLVFKMLRLDKLDKKKA